MEHAATTSFVLALLSAVVALVIVGRRFRVHRRRADELGHAVQRHLHELDMSRAALDAERARSSELAAMHGELQDAHTQLRHQHADATTRLVRCETELSGRKSLLEERDRKIEQDQQARADIDERLNECQHVIADLRESRATDRQRIAELEEREAELARARERIDRLTEVLGDRDQRIATLETQLDEEKRATEEKLQLLQASREELEEKFKGIAAQVLEHNTQKFTGVAQERLGQVSAELGKAMGELKKKVEEAHSSDMRDRTVLKTQLAHMVEASQQLDAEAKNLTRALTGDRRAQGAWGELTLDTLLEQCGMQEGREYEKQASYRNGEDRTLRPDVIVHLPGDRSVVIDAKVSLTAYNDYVNAESDEDAAAAQARHTTSVRNHIKNLASKDYWRLNDLETGDYVLMFLPIEPAFAEALRHSPGLFEEAFKHNVILTSPCTLLATLRTIEHTWRVERQNETARAIVDRAGALYDKFAGFATDLSKVGERLGQAQTAYNGALNKLSTGQGNLVRQAERLRELGVKVRKALPSEVVGMEGEAVFPDDESNCEQQQLACMQLANTRDR